jgi:hypothetical protein
MGIDVISRKNYHEMGSLSIGSRGNDWLQSGRSFSQTLDLPEKCCSTCHAGHDSQTISLPNWSILALQGAYVVFVQEKVHIGLQATLTIEQILLKVREFLGELL